MQKRLKFILYHLSLLILICLGLSSCGNQNSNSNASGKEDKIYIESFEYSINENECSVPNELSYTLSFEIGFSLKENATITSLNVVIEDKKKSNFTIDYCNTEGVRLSKDSYGYPRATLDYAILENDESMTSIVNLKITTSILIDDINNFIQIACYDGKGYHIYSKNKDLLENGFLKMNYSSDTLIYYEFDEFRESYKVVSVFTNSKIVNIPAMYMNYPVKTIDEKALEAVSHIEKLILPETLTFLPRGLLCHMWSLRSLTLPFAGGSPADEEFGYIGYLYNDKSIPVTIKEIIIKGGTRIGDRDFSRLSILSLTLPDTIASIGNEAFRDCHYLIDVTIPDDVISIGESAFYNCLSLTSVILPSGVTEIGQDAFAKCDNLKEVFYKGTEASWKAMDIGSGNNNLTFFATRYFFSDEKPNDSGNYWHYVDGVITKW